MKSSILVAIVGLSSFLSSAAIADTTITASQGLENMIQKSNEQKQAANAKKLSQIIALAGSKQDEITRSKDAVAYTYKNWHDLKCAVEMSHNKANSKDLMAITAAAQAYSKATKDFIVLQKDILTNANIPFKNQATYLVMR
jgi:phosphotransferase system HPr-like phosphotransfer protein